MPVIEPVLPCLLFPPRSWWRAVADAGGRVCVSVGPPLRSTAYRNRYRIATANGAQLLSVPVVGGRRAGGALTALFSDDRQAWQRTHWRSLFSAYGRAPFFEYLGPELEALIMESGISMAERNLRSIRWMARCMRLRLDIVTVDAVPEAARPRYLELSATEPELPPYRQVFDERHGFIPGLSALDLLMMQGPQAGRLL